MLNQLLKKLPVGIKGHNVINIAANKQISRSLKYCFFLKDLIRCREQKYIKEKKIKVKKKNPNIPNSVKN